MAKSIKKIVIAFFNRNIAFLILICILFLAFFLRYPLLDKIIVFDEYVQTKAVLEHNPVGLDKGTEIPPLTNWTRIFFIKLFGFSTFNLKMCSLIFGLATILLVYLLGTSMFNKKTGLLAAFLMAISAWHALGSTSISFDGTFLTFYQTLTIYLFYKFFEAKDNLKSSLYLIFSGVAFGLAMLTKLNAILIIPILLLYTIFFSKRRIFISRNSLNHRISFNIKNLKFIFNSFLIMLMVSIIIFSIFPILAYLTDWSYFTVVLGHTSVFASSGHNLILIGIQFFQAILWIGPMLITFYFLHLIFYSRKAFYKYSLLHIWIWVVVLFFTFGIQEDFRPVERYFFVLLPALVIICANFIYNIFKDMQFKELLYNIFSKKNLYLSIFFIFSLIVIFTIVIATLFYIPQRYLPFYPKEEFYYNVINLKWDFMVPFTGDQGPVGFYLPFSFFASVFIIIFIFYIFFSYSKHMVEIYSKRKLIIKMIVSVIFLIGLIYSGVMIIQQIKPIVGPDINLVNKELISYSQNYNLPKPIYVFRNYAYKYYLGRDIYGVDIIPLDFINITTLHSSNDSYLKNVLLNEIKVKEPTVNKSYTFVLLNFPYIGENNVLLNQIFVTCELIYSYPDVKHGHNLGMIYIC